MSFRQVGEDFSGALDNYSEAQDKEKKQKAITDFVTRQLARLPPEKQAEAKAMLAGPQPQALPATTLMDGTPDSPIPPEISGQQPQSISDLFSAPPPDLTALVPPKPDPGAESLRMLLEATRDNAMEPKGLFDYIAGMGKQDMVGANQTNLETMKENLRRDMQTADHNARLDRLEKILENKTDLNQNNIDSREGINDNNNATKTSIAGANNATKKEVADKNNVTKKEVSAATAGKSGVKNPDTMTPEEIDAELKVYRARADSLDHAGGDPKAVRYKPAEEKFASIDEGSRQKDLSKAEDRITALTAAKARKQANSSGAPVVPVVPSPAPAPAAGAVYTSKSDITADLANGKIKPGQKVQFKMPDGSTVLVNTGK